MKQTLAKKQQNEIIENLKNGVEYGNEKAGWSYSYGQVNMKICVDRSIKFYSTVELMAKAIKKSIKYGY